MGGGPGKIEKPVRSLSCGERSGFSIPLANARLILEESYANVCVTLLFSPKKESDNEE